MLIICALMGGPVVDTVAADAPGHTLGRPGYLIISAARDSNARYRWTDGPVRGQKSLVWDSGLLVIPDSLTLEPFGAEDLGVRTSSSLQGRSGAGELDFRDGVFTVDQPLLLTDGVISLYIAGGELEIRGSQLRYRRSAEEEPAARHGPADPRAGFLFLAGIVILIVVLMRRARLQARKSR